MIRPAIVLALLLSAAVMMRGVASDWRKSPLAPADNAVKKATPAGEAMPAAQQVKALQPVVPGVLPDLKMHYLFNPERMLAGADMPPAEVIDSEAASGNAQGITASMGEVTYAGSIIADNFSRAIILYPAAKSKPQPVTSKSSKGKAPPPAKSGAGGTEEHAQLEVGDVLDGYTVAEILPNKLIFTKGEETVEKLLYDSAKKRQAPPPRPAAAPFGAGGPPRPQQIPVGGPTPPTPPAPGTVAQPASPAPPAPGAVAPPAPPPALPPGIKQPAAAGAAKTNPFRQMVISRQTAPAPDTSRVNRQSSGGDAIEPPPMPPMPPGGADAGAQPIDTPPPLPEGN